MEEETTWKLSRFEDFIKLTKRLALDGSNKYAAGEPYKKEAIEIITDVMGEEGYTNFVLGDLLKRIIRFKNQRRERDLLKIALWSYLLWMRLFPRAGEGEEEKSRVCKVE
jgi:hypothetical protein